MNKKIIIAGISCTFLLISGICYSCSFKEDSSQSSLKTTLSHTKVTPSPSVAGDKNTTSVKSEQTDSNSNRAPVATTIYVHICGAVSKSGVYEVESDSRISDLIKLAGGLSKKAAGDYINQAKKVSDGERIYIPTVDEVAKLSKQQLLEGDKSSDSGNNQDTTQQSQTSGTRVNINIATAEQLMNLPGIGQSKAESIISFRTENGKFKKIDDLMKISGIKEGLFGKIKAYIIVE